MQAASFAARVDELDAIRNFVIETARALDANPTAIDDMVAAVDEAATNIILHGYAGRPGTIAIEIRRERSALVVFLRDHAPDFDPTTVPPPDLNLPLEQRRLGGLGIHLIRAYIDRITYRTMTQGGNELTLVKKAFFKEG
jgi:serine/threonine-protein kinase RsbW